MGPSPNRLWLLLYACISRHRHGRHGKPKNLGIAEKDSELTTTASTQHQSDGPNSATSSPITPKQASSARRKGSAGPSDWPEDKCASSPPTPRQAGGSNRDPGRDLTAWRSRSVVDSEFPKEHVPDEAENERRRRGDAQPQVVPLELMGTKRPASRDIADVWTDRRLEKVTGDG